MNSLVNRVGLDIFTSLPDVAGWQALNEAGLTEDRIERVVSRLPDDTFPLDAISVELNRVFASVHMNKHVSSTPAIPPGRAWSSNERERVPRNPRPHHRWGQSRPTFAAERTQNQSASSAQWDTFEEVVDTEDEDNDGSDTINPGDLQEYVRDELEVLATCMDNGENDAPIPGVDNSQMETACLKLAELPEALAIVQAARRLRLKSTFSRASPGGKGKSRQPFGRQRVPNNAREWIAARPGSVARRASTTAEGSAVAPTVGRVKFHTFTIKALHHCATPVQFNQVWTCRWKSDRLVWDTSRCQAQWAPDPVTNVNI